MHLYLIVIVNRFINKLSYKPYAIASMIFLSKVKNPQEVLAMLEKRNKERKVK